MCEPATERQKAFARDLDLVVEPDVTKSRLSELISAALGDFSRFPPLPTRIDEARRRSIRFRDSISAEDLDELIDDHQWVCRWVYSVCRYLARADWILHKDARLDDGQVHQIAEALRRDTRIFDFIADCEEGTAPLRFEDDVERRWIDRPDEWFFFNTEFGPSTRSNAYKKTVALLLGAKE